MAEFDSLRNRRCWKGEGSWNGVGRDHHRNLIWNWRFGDWNGYGQWSRAVDFVCSQRDDLYERYDGNVLRHF